MSLQANSQNKNTAESAVAGAYRLIDVSITNAYGKVFDIKNLVTKIIVVESIYTLALTAEIEVRDTANIFEELRISGQEQVDIVIQRRHKKTLDNEKLIMKFFVSEIPLYGKVNDHVQGYTLKCVSEHAFVNALTKVSRSVSGSMMKAISKIITGDLRYDGIVQTDAESKGNIKLIIPNMRPFQAISWMLRHSFGQEGTPVFAYESLDGFKIHSYYYMTSQDSVGKYKYNFLQRSDPGTKEGYEQQKYKILDMSSDMNGSRYIHAGNGAFASTTKVLDVATKRYYEVTFDYLSKFNNMPKVDHNGKSILSSKFTMKDQSLNHHHDSLYIYMNENSLANGSYGNYHSPAVQSIGQHQSHLETMDMFKQTITVYGDTQSLNAGKKISIEAPKAIDPQVYKKVQNADAKKKSSMNDMMISGDYIITSVKHIFDTDYKCQLLLKKDYSNYSLDEAE